MELRQTHQSVQPFRTQDEYLYAMKEDLAEWFNGLYDLYIGVSDFFQQLENGVVICRHANNVQHHMLQQLGLGDAPPVGREGSPLEHRRGSSTGLPGEGAFGIYYRTNVRSGTFQSRDNISNFIAWCRHTLQIPDTLLFETDDLVLRKNERNVVLCLLEVARRGSKFGLPVPVLVQLEQEIDAEIAAEAGGATVDQGQVYQSLKKRNPIKVDMKSLDELVREVLGRCTCPDQFPMIKVSDGKYKIGDSLTMIFLRILRSHVMVRIGGGWDTLENYLNRHDPCRCQYKAGHGQLLNTWSATTTKEDSTSMSQQLPEDNSTRSTPGSNLAKTRSPEVNLLTDRTTERSTNLPTSFNNRLSAFDATDSTPNGVGVSRRRSDEVTKQKPSKSNLSLSNPAPDSNRRSQSPMTGTTYRSRRAVGVQEDSSQTGSTPGRGKGTSNRSRRSSVDSPFHRRAQSIERQPRPTEQTPPPRPASAAGRARSVDPFGPGLSRALPRSASRSRERPAKGPDLLIIARDKEGKHRVKDTPRNEDTKISNAEGVAGLNANHSIKDQQQQQSRVKASRMQISASKLLPSKPRPLARSTSGSLDNKADMERPETEGSSSHEFRRTLSFTPVTTEPEDDRTTDAIVEFCSPLSPTKPDLLVEEYRKIGLGIQDLLKNAEDLDNTRCPVDREPNSDVKNDDSNLLNNLDVGPFQNDTSTLTPKIVRTTTRLPSANSSDSVSKKLHPGDQTKGHGRSSPAGVLEDMSSIGASQPKLAGVVPGKVVERSRRALDVADRKALRTQSCSRERGKDMSLPQASSSTRNQRASSCASRTRSHTKDEKGRSDASIAGNRSDHRRMGNESEKDSGQRRSRTTSAQNWDKRYSMGSGEIISVTTQQNAVTNPLRKPRAASNSRCPSAEPGHNRQPDVTSLHAVDDINKNLSMNLDDYCRKALTRKDIMPGSKPSSRIPMPIEVKQSLQLNAYPKGYGQLKRVDSGVDINNMSPGY